LESRQEKPLGRVAEGIEGATTTSVHPSMSVEGGEA
jgi:hypothetical protein